MKRVSGPRRVGERRFCVLVTQARARDLVAPNGVRVRIAGKATKGEDPQVRGSARGESRTPRPFGHRILRLVRSGTDPASTCRPVSSGVNLCHPMSFRHEQVVSENGASPAPMSTWNVVRLSRGCASALMLARASMATVLSGRGHHGASRRRTAALILPRT
jgi:hypothetical protein